MDYKFYVGFVIMGVIVETVAAMEDEDATSNITAIQGDDASLPCTVLDTLNKTEVNWTDPNGAQLTHGENVLRSSERYSVDSWDLQIKDVDFSDSGTYVCEIKSDTPQRKSIHFDVKAPAVRNGTENETTQSPTTEDPNSFSTTVVINSVDSGTETETTQSPTTEDPNSGSTTVVINSVDSGTETETTQSPTTEDPNSCSSIRPCNNSGTCENGTCTCINDFTGSFCEVPTVCPVSACNRNNTQNCSVELEKGSYIYSCSCLPFYTGKQCEIYNFCETHPCQNRGHCKLLYQNPESRYTCDCHIGDPNNDCKLNDRDDCKATPPSNPDTYITCIDQIDSFKMYCSPGYSGEQSRCNDTVKPELYCDRYGPGNCSDEGYCKPLCNVDVCSGTENCKFTADPYNATGFVQKPDCVKAFGDGYDHRNCHGEDTLFDGFDATINGLRDCSPFFDTICTRDFGNGDCNPECNNSDCLHDGFDCLNHNELAGVIIVELKGSLGTSLNAIKNRLSMMLRSGVNLTIETFKDEPASLLSLKITNTVFTDIEYAGKFLAAVVAKRPGWLDGAKIKDIFVCPAGSYSDTYSDKCRLNCSTCSQKYEICDWKTGECLYGCSPAHWGGRCQPCDKCKQDSEICDSGSGECRCKAGYWGPQCSSCDTCKQEGDVCKNATGECLHGCISHDFYGPMCLRCPQNCIGGCNEKGYCCDATSGACICKDGYYGSKCTFQCMENCLNGKCYVNGTCDKGCDSGYYGPMCETACPIGCNACARDGGLCKGKCKPGYEGSTCEKSTGKSGYIDDVTDNTGVIIGVVISLLLLVLILFVACWRKRKSRDYVTEDEEMEAPPTNDSSTTRIQVHTNMHMQSTSPLLGHSLDVIELDEKQNFAATAGSGRGQPAENGDNGKGPEEKEPEVDKSQLSDDNADDVANKKAEDTGTSSVVIEIGSGGSVLSVSDGDEEKSPTLNKKGKGPEEKEPEVDKSQLSDDNADDVANKNAEDTGTSSVVIEIGSGGSVLSVSDGDEEKSPTLNKKVELPIGEEEESMEDDSTFAEPPHSPLGEVPAPLASEENILASLGSKETEHDAADEPAGLNEELEKEEAKESKRSRSNSSSSSSSSSKKSSKEGKHEITTEM